MSRRHFQRRLLPVALHKQLHRRRTREAFIECFATGLQEAMPQAIGESAGGGGLPSPPRGGPPPGGPPAGGGGHGGGGGGGMGVPAETGGGGGGDGIDDDLQERLNNLRRS